MYKKKLFGVLLFCAGILLISSRIVLTGNSVLDSFYGFNFSFNFIGMILILSSILIFTSKKTLD